MSFEKQNLFTLPAFFSYIVETNSSVKILQIHPVRQSHSPFPSTSPEVLLTHFLRDALYELSHQLLSRGDQGFFLAETQQVVPQRTLHLLLAFVQLALLSLQSGVTIQQSVQGGCGQFLQLQLAVLQHAE